ncbi:hypothetical protein DN752_19135 [Echinicola strongylocentroti]|uniref:Uncharacterized protein n=1 Tax=Echinicola strongylocentroti TaxID=1795355 RepID=A0A2Z4IMX5_9BACT|nr:hypothetical protein DN752_19135 [Echinicola strongylocentroti]
MLIVPGHSRANAFIPAVTMELTLLCVAIFGAGDILHLLYDPPPKADWKSCAVANYKTHTILFPI